MTDADHKPITDAELEEEKRCSSCKLKKPRSEFNKCRTSFDGLYAYCRPCAHRKKKEWLEKNKERDRERSRRYYQSHREQYAARQREFYARHREEQLEKIHQYQDKNRESLNAKARERYQQNKEQHAANACAWRQSNPGAKLAQCHLQRALERGQIHAEPCAICGVPKVEGHHWDYANALDVTWLCRSHHQQVHRGVRAPQLRAQLGHPDWVNP